MLNKILEHKKYFYLIIILLSFFMIGIFGFNYYLAPISERFYIPQHNLLKPTGFLGHGLGIIGTFFILFGVISYMTRKRVRAFNKAGGMKYWLEFHIFLCTLGPILVLYHTTFKFGGLVSVSFWSMAAVVLSGVIGRFIYIQIPRSIKGRELTLDEAKNALTELVANSVNINNVNFNGDDFFNAKINKSNFYRSLVYITRENFRAHKKIRDEKKNLKKQKLDKKTKKERVKNLRAMLIMKRKIAALQTMQKLFQYWHIAHLPFAIIMLIIMIIHVIVALSFGYTWL